MTVSSTARLDAQGSQQSVPDLRPGHAWVARCGTTRALVSNTCWIQTRVGYKHVFETNDAHKRACRRVSLKMPAQPCAGVEGASGDWEQDGLPLAIPGCSYEPGSALPCENLPGEP